MAWVPLTDLPERRAANARETREVELFARRRAKPRFYADENFPPLATEVLRNLDASVVTVQEQRRRGHPDENVISETRRLRRVLITRDRDFLDERRHPIIQCPVVVVCDFGSGTPLEIWRTFRCLWEIFRVPQFFDKWAKFDARPGSWIETLRFQDGTATRVRRRFSRGRLEEWVG
jgi:predicted nuclease of predicted toxin-antitoxin system